MQHHYAQCYIWNAEPIYLLQLQQAIKYPPLHAAALSAPVAAAALASVKGFLRFETICSPGAPLSVSEVSSRQFEGALSHIKTTYDAFLSSDDVTVNEVNRYSLLLEWKGSRPELPGILVYGHYDVVPVGEDSSSSWSHEPFGGQSFDGYVNAEALGQV
jgi:acetylornithine deacetylase/succinyl-diaminopimelate desuccinylase-like protein